MTLVFLAHPVGAPTLIEHRANLARAKRWLAFLIRAFPQHAFTMPYLQYCEVLDDSDADDRARGIAMDRVVLRRCDELWLIGGRISRGMNDELEYATEHEIPVHNYISWGEEPNEHDW